LKKGWEAIVKVPPRSKKGKRPKQAGEESNFVRGIKRKKGELARTDRIKTKKLISNKTRSDILESKGEKSTVIQIKGKKK